MQEAEPTVPGRIRPRPLRSPGSQSGAALISLVLALALGSGLVSIGWLEATARSAHHALRTEAALAAARDALIGYAVSYPDQHSGRDGPGYLPCPDTSGNGSPNSPCRATAFGRLPWRRLGLHDPRDGAGERLWYGLGRRFRANGYKHRPLNLETAAELVVNGRQDIAAVILAPGPALSFQDRHADRSDPAQFLEGGNETPEDGTYASPPSPSPAGDRATDRFNDRVTTISRDELMAASGRRVLAAVQAALAQYRDAPWNSGALPWLAPWGATNGGPVPAPGVAAGALPVVGAGESFASSFRVSGAPPDDRAPAPGTIDGAALAMLAAGISIPSGTCAWTVISRVDCSGETRVPLGPDGERVFRFDLHLAGDPAVLAPTATDIRRRGVRGAQWLAASHVEVVDLVAGAEIGRSRLEFPSGPVEGWIAIDGIAFPLGAGEEVPEWLVENQWHRFVLAAVAPAFAAGGDGACAGPGRCLELVRTTFDGRTRESSAAAVAVLAGPVLGGQNRDSSDHIHWFEGENANPASLRFELRHPNDAFNDRVAVIPAPEGVSGR